MRKRIVWAFVCMLVVAMVFLGSCGSKSSDSSTTNTGTTYTLSVDGKNNAINIDTTAAAHTAIPAGTYSTAISGNASYAGTVPYKKVYVMYDDGSTINDLQLDALSIGSTSTLEVASGFNFYAFFMDRIPLTDNSGSVTLTFGSNSLSVDGTSNCINIDSTVAAHISIPNGTYTVQVSGNASYAGTVPYMKVYVMYDDGTANDLRFDALTVGSTTTLTIANGFDFYAFFADRVPLTDNSGSVTLTFTKQ